VKKVRINLKPGSKIWSFFIYDSAESAYYLKDEDHVLEDESLEEYCKEVSLKRGEVLEVEWMGSEFIYDDETLEKKTPIKLSHEKYDAVRIGKLTKIKTVGYKTGYVETFAGWVKSDLFLPSKDTQDIIKITKINGKKQSKLDFSQLFQSNFDYKMDLPIEDENEIDVLVLN
jgi:hypothetical protein